MRKKTISPTDWIKNLEVDLRGTYLRIAVDAEWMLVIIIHECLKSNPKEVKNYYTFKNGRKKDINDLTLDEKIELSKLLISKKHPTIYKRHYRLFTTINLLRDYRNKFAHCKIDPAPPPHDKTHIILSTILKGFRVKQQPKRISSLKASLRKYEKKMGETLIMLTSVLKITHPAALF